MKMGEYRVVGKREYRGHKPGQTFQRNIPAAAAQRAIDRGDIVLVRTITPELQHGSWCLPDGWVAKQGKE